MPFLSGVQRGLSDGWRQEHWEFPPVPRRGSVVLGTVLAASPGSAFVSGTSLQQAVRSDLVPTVWLSPSLMK